MPRALDSQPSPNGNGPTTPAPTTNNPVAPGTPTSNATLGVSSARTTLISQTPRASIYRYNTPYVASPDSSAPNTPSRPTSSNPPRSTPSVTIAGSLSHRPPLLSRPTTPSSAQSPAKKQLPSSPLARQEPISIDDEEIVIEERPPGVADYVAHVGNCAAKTLMTLAYGVALLDVKCLAAGRTLYNSICNNYRVDKLLFILTCAAILFSISISLSSSSTPSAISPGDLDAQIKEAIEKRLTNIQNLIRKEISKEKGVSRNELESAYRQFSTHINEQMASKFELQDKKVTEKAAEVAVAYLRTLEEKTSTMEQINADVSEKYAQFNEAMEFLRSFEREVQALKSLTATSPLVTKEQLDAALKEQQHAIFLKESENMLELRDFVKHNFVPATRLTSELEKFRSQQQVDFEKIISSKLEKLPKDKSLDEQTVRSWVLQELASSSSNANKETVRSLIQDEVRQSLSKLEPSEQTIEKVAHKVVEKTVVDIVDRYASSLSSIETQKATIQQWIDEAFAKYGASSSSSTGDWSDIRITRVIEDALERFAADRIGRADFAIRTAGASIVESRTSESYGQNWWSNLPIPFSRRIVTQPPSVILEPDVTVGRCWAFAGGHGRVTVELSEPVVPTSFTLDHISPSVAHVRGLASAPKDFTVYGLHNVTDSGTWLGSYTYDTSIGRSTQTFAVEASNDVAFPIISLEVTSNYGHHYTCLYRFRVHATV